MKSNSMQQNVTQQLINRRTADGKWLQGCDHTAILLNPKTRNKIIEQAISEIKNPNYLLIRLLAVELVVCW
jgi:hypothetical protein